LSLDGVGKEAVEPILAVSHVEVDAGIVAPINMGFATLARTLIDCKVLFRTEILYCLKLTF
jgi:hypothetical protein